VISAAENSNKFPKNQVLEGKNSWEYGNSRWRLTIQFKHDILSYLAVQKIDTYIAKQCSHVEFPYFVMGLHIHGKTMFTCWVSLYFVVGLHIHCKTMFTCGVSLFCSGFAHTLQNNVHMLSFSLFCNGFCTYIAKQCSHVEFLSIL
jgi:hypothetical protein